MAEDVINAEETEDKKPKSKDEVRVAVIACERSVNLEGELNQTKLNGNPRSNSVKNLRRLCLLAVWRGQRRLLPTTATTIHQLRSR